VYNTWALTTLHSASNDVVRNNDDDVNKCKLEDDGECTARSKCTVEAV